MLIVDCARPGLDANGHRIKLVRFIEDIIAVFPVPFVPVRVFDNHSDARPDLLCGIDNIAFRFFEEEFCTIVSPALVSTAGDALLARLARHGDPRRAAERRCCGNGARDRRPRG